MRTKLYDADKAAILEAFKNGEGIYDISDRLGIQPGSIHRFLDENGYIKHLKQRITKDDEDDIVKLFKEGLPVVKISKMLMILPGVIRRVLQEKGLMKTGSGRKATVLTEENKKEIIRMHIQEKVGITAIAMFMHTNANAIRHVLRDAGIEPIDYTLKPRVFTDEEKEKIRELYDERWCTENVAKELHSNAERIAKELKAMGYKLHAGRRRVLVEDVAPEDKERVICLYVHGHKIEQIASWVDLPAETVKRLLKENNVERPKMITVDEMLANPEYEPMSFERFDELEFYKSQGIDVRKKRFEKRGKSDENMVDFGGNSTLSEDELRELEESIEST